MKGIKEVFLPALKTFIEKLRPIIHKLEETEKQKAKETPPGTPDPYGLKVAYALLVTAEESQAIVTPIQDDGVIVAGITLVKRSGDVKKRVALITDALNGIGGLVFPVVNESSKQLAQELISLLAAISPPSKEAIKAGQISVAKGLPDMLIEFILSPPQPGTKLSATERLTQEFDGFIMKLKNNITSFEESQVINLKYQKYSQEKNQIISDSKQEFITPISEQEQILRKELDQIITEMKTCIFGKQALKTNSTSFLTSLDKTLKVTSKNIAGVNGIMHKLPDLPTSFKYYLINEKEGEIVESTANFKNETANALRFQVREINKFISNLGGMKVVFNMMNAALIIATDSSSRKTNNSPLTQPVKVSAMANWLIKPLIIDKPTQRSLEEAMLFLQQSLSVLDKSDPLSQAVEKALIEMFILDKKISRKDYQTALTARQESTSKTDADPVQALIKTQMQKLAFFKTPSPETQARLETLEKLHEYLFKQLKITGYTDEAPEKNEKISFTQKLILALNNMSEDIKLPNWSDSAQPMPKELEQIIAEYKEPTHTTSPRVEK